MLVLYGSLTLMLYEGPFGGFTAYELVMYECDQGCWKEERRKTQNPKRRANASQERSSRPFCSYRSQCQPGAE